jgi:peroxiredoxin
LQPDMAVFGKKHVTDKKNVQTRTDRKICLYGFPGIYTPTFVYFNNHIYKHISNLPTLV